MKYSEELYLESIGNPWKPGASLEERYLGTFHHRPRALVSREETPGSLLSDLHIRKTLKNKFYAELKLGRKSEDELEEEYVRKLKNDGKTVAEARRRIELWKSDYPSVELDFSGSLEGGD